MQSSLCASSCPPYFSLPCESSRAYRRIQNPIFKSPCLVSGKTLALSNSLRTSTDYETKEAVHDEFGPGDASTALLPVVITSSGRVSRYLWNENRLELVGIDGGSPSARFHKYGFRELWRASSAAVRDFFIPKQVKENYLSYVKWKLLHRVFSSALQVLATQAMFRAMGVGHSRSLPSAAAFNWIMKEGLGRLSRCIFTASLASAFDTNLKRVRLSTSVLFSLSIGVELLTPNFPQYFLLLASVANIAKQISLACYLATGSAVYRSFAIADNIGEVSAKAQIQTVCFDNLGLMLAAALNMLLYNNQRLQVALPFFIYPIFSAIDLFGIYQGLKHVNLQTLTKDRLEIILDKWIKFRSIPSPAEVSKDEGIGFLWAKGKESWPIRIGSLDLEGQIPELSRMIIGSVSSEDYYFICPENISRGLRQTRQQGIVICFREGASTRHVIMGLLQACYIREALSSSNIPASMMVGNKCTLFDSFSDEWFNLVELGKRCAKGDSVVLSKRMGELGWAVKNVLLDKQEQTRYSFMDD